MALINLYIFLLIQCADLGIIVGNDLTNGDLNVSKLATFLGLEVRCINVENDSLSMSDFIDENGFILKGIGVSHATLCNFVDSTGLFKLSKYVESGGNLLIYGVKSVLPLNKIKYFLGYKLDTVECVQSTGEETYVISKLHPEMTLEFTGMQFPFRQGHFDYVQKNVDINNKNVIVFLENGIVFSVYEIGDGFLFLDSGYQSHSLGSAYFKPLYSAEYFSLLVPMLFYLKYVFGDECWHGFKDYANLTIDDPWLVQPFYHIDYFQLLNEMDAHNFHTTIAFIPKNFVYTQQEVADLFVQRRDRYSIVQHGNNHDGREFYFPSQQQVDSMCQALGGVWCDTTIHFPRPLNDQLADMLEGLTRLYEHERRFGIRFGKIMVFPWGLAPLVTLPLLKSCNYIATVNGQIVPLGEHFPPKWDYGVHPCEDYFADFPLIWRQHPCSSYNPPVFEKENWPFILFLDRPLLLYSHQHQIFGDGMDGFNPAADFIYDSIWGEVEWASLEDIVKHLYWQKINDDGFVQIWSWTSDLVVTNPYDCAKVFHLFKYETQNIPIRSVYIDDMEVAYSLVSDTLWLEFELGPRDSCEVKIIYGDSWEDFVILPQRVGFIEPDTLFFWIFNYGLDGGICPHTVRGYSGESEDTLLALGVTSLLEAGESLVVEISGIVPDCYDSLCIELDPYNVVYEAREDNNTVKVDFSTLFRRNQEQRLCGELQGLSGCRSVSKKDSTVGGLEGQYHSGDAKSYNVSLYDVSGRLIGRKGSINSHIEAYKFPQLMIENLKSGIYFVILDDTISHERIVKKVLVLK